MAKNKKKFLAPALPLLVAMVFLGFAKVEP
jgi:hypothetical protein